MPSMPRPGDILAGRYLLIDLLAEAEDGRFWRSHDRILARHVGVHVLPAGTPRAERLLAAARGCARLTDRRFLRVLDAEVKDGTCYVVTEWGTGTSLALMLEHAPLAPKRAAWMVSEVAGAMATAHAVGVTHGRLAPENILVDLSGTVRIVGTQVDAAIKGLPKADEAADVHEIVSLLYAALTGRWPGRSPSAMPAAPVDGETVLRPRQVRAGIPRVLDELCDDVLNAPSPPRAPYDLTTARGVADYLREFVGDPALVAAAEAERGAGGRAQYPDVPRELLTPAPVVLPHDAQPRESANGATAGAANSGAPQLDATTVRSKGRRRAEPKPTEPTEPTGSDATSVRTTAVAAGAAGASAGSAPTEAAAGGDAAPKVRARPADTFDVPTQAGVPIFDDDEEAEVGWLAKRSEKPPPPPEFEDPPERPLFAPESEEEIEARRRAREEAAHAPVDTGVGHTGHGGGDDYWPWATGLTTGSVLSRPVQDPGVRRRDRPGRTWLQLAGFLGGLVVLLIVVALTVHFVSPGGDDNEQGSGDSSSSAPAESGTTPTTGAQITGLTATVLDPAPDGNGEENDDEIPNAFDDDTSTAWTTLTYDQQFGPNGLKDGVGLQIDLGEERTVSGVDLQFDGSPTSAELFLTPEKVDSVEGLEAVGSVEDADGGATIPLDGATGRYLTVWLTSLPDGYQGGLVEVKVFE